MGAERDQRLGPQGHSGGGHVDGDDTAQAVGRDAHRTDGAAPKARVYLVDDLAYAGVDSLLVALVDEHVTEEARGAGPEPAPHGVVQSRAHRLDGCA
ncbi:hypothetical protein [Streptomyces olivochromogenes]|uniref:hypothetical protein n=1 Tax=Streptomyces olivochromogenes TaxID=1963 RepID=UPI0036A48D47